MAPASRGYTFVHRSDCQGISRTAQEVKSMGVGSWNPDGFAKAFPLSGPQTKDIEGQDGQELHPTFTTK